MRWFLLAVFVASAVVLVLVAEASEIEAPRDDRPSEGLIPPISIVRELPATTVAPTTTTTAEAVIVPTVQTQVPTTVPRARTAPIVPAAPPVLESPVSSSRSSRGWTWDELAGCESGGNWADTRNGHQGGVHFAPSTWDRYRTHWLNDPTLPADANLATRDQQIRVAEKVLELQGPGAWPICSYRVGMR